MFVSTDPLSSSLSRAVSFEEALRNPIPSHGHLWMPTLPLPTVEWPEDAGVHVYISKAVEALTGHTFNFESILSCCPISVDRSKNPCVLNLSLGPTKSFKDFGCLCASQIYRELGMTDRTLVATSGDTGSAAAHAFEKSNLPITVLFPSNRVSTFQAHQMVTLCPNSCVMAVEGDFDECQKIVKSLIQDTETRVQSCNSISLARLLPQIGYYCYLASRCPNHQVIVPSGNFGNACAAAMAKCMGARIASVHFACNANDAVVRFLNGEDPSFIPKSTRTTLATAMDVGHPSNFIRILYLCNHDTGEFRRRFTASVATDIDIMTQIRANPSLCPHTATATHAASSMTGRKMCIVQTADARKFTSTLTMPYAPVCVRSCKFGKRMRNIVLIGMPSAGKSTVSKIMNGVDTDRILSERYKAPLHSIIQEKGIDEFILLEGAVATETVQKREGVIATGGSVVYSDEFRNALTDSLVVWLEADLATLAERLGDSWNSRGVVSPHGTMELQPLWKERDPLFQSIVDIRIDTTEWEPDRIVQFLHSAQY